ncbi:MAG: NAD(P)-binding domain-containing protein, partial [Gammaproteobacteria bacterium]|nr:NAD(P)-binding domain-containing protein [Gammaproteobacteria bacterium]
LSMVSPEPHPSIEGELDLAIIGAGLCGVIALYYARQAGLAVKVFEKYATAGGLWSQLPTWQDIQISELDWKIGDLPLHGHHQPAILANIQAWVSQYALATDILFNCPVRRVRRENNLWLLETPHQVVRARHLLAATGGHNLPYIPDMVRRDSQIQEFHAASLSNPNILTGSKVLVVGGGASAFDLIEQSFLHGARQVAWVYRGLKWFLPTGKPKNVAGSVRGFARMQGAGLSFDQQNELMRTDMLARYQRFGIDDLKPSQPFDVRFDQLMPGRALMLARYHEIHRYAAEVMSIQHDQVHLSQGLTLQADVVLWGTGYCVDLSYFADPDLARIQTLSSLAKRVGGFLSQDYDHLYFPSLGLDGIGSASFNYALICRSIISQVCGRARLERTQVAHHINHFDLVDYFAPRDPSNYPGDWQKHYRDLALHTPDTEPYPIPLWY